MFCGKCGHKFSSTNMAFCTQCGTKIPNAEPIGASAEQLEKPKVMNKKTFIAVVAASIAIISVLIIALLFFGDSNEEDISVPSIDYSEEMTGSPDYEPNDDENEQNIDSNNEPVRVRGVELIAPPIYVAFGGDLFGWVFSEGLAAVAVDNMDSLDDMGMLLDPAFTRLWGFIDTEGNEIIPPRYNIVQPFSDGLAVVIVLKDDGSVESALWGAIDTAGNEVIPPSSRFNLIRPFSYGLGAVFVGDIETLMGHWGFIDAAGNEVISLSQYNIVEPFSDGLAAVFVGDIETGEGLVGFIDTAGNEVIPLRFDGLGSGGLLGSGFYNGMATVSVDNRWGIIDAGGNWLVQPRYDNIWGISEGIAIVSIGERETALWGFTDLNGNEIVPPRYNWVSSFSDGFATVMSSDNLEGLIDTEGNYVIPPRFSGVRGFSEGLAAVRDGNRGTGLWGFIDVYGNEAIPLIYDSVGSFNEGVAAVRVGDMETGLWGFIDTAGNEIISPRYNAVRFENFFEGLIAVRVGNMETGLWGFIDITGNEIIPPTYNSINEFSEELVLVREGNTWSFMNTVGEKFPIELGYDISEIRNADNGFAKILVGDWETGLWGLIRVITD